MKKSLLRQGKEDKPKGCFFMRHGNLEAQIVPLAVDGKRVIGIGWGTDTGVWRCSLTGSP